MADRQTWTAADDDLVKASLESLGSDVETLPLPEVQLVRARGAARRRRTLLGWTAGAAAAVVVAATVGYASLGRDAAQPVPPARASATTTAPSPTTPAGPPLPSPLILQPAALPLAAEWTYALQWSSDFTRSTDESYEADPCLGPTGGEPVQAESLLSAQGNIQGGQTRWVVPASRADQVARQMGDAIGRCALGSFSVRPEQTTSWPHLYSYTAGDAGSGWYAVTVGGSGVAVLNIVEPDHATTRFSQAQVGRLASIATERLARYTGRTPGAGTPTTPPPRSAPGENMPVSGLKPLLPSSLFVPASEWASPAMTVGQRTYAGPGAQEGSASVAPCETEEFQAGVGGRYGIVSIRSGTGTAGYIGKQRVRLFEDVDAAGLARADVARLEGLLSKGCTFANGTVRSTRGPVAGTYRLDTVFTDGSPTLTTFAGFTTQRTPGAVSTVVVTKIADPARGFAEVERLLGLARRN